MLVVPLIYHQTTPKPAPKTSSITVTRSLDLAGSGVASFTQRRTTDADRHPRPMNDLQTLLTNIEELKVQFTKSFETIESAVSMLQTQQQQQVVNVDQTALKFVEFFTQELDKNITGGKLFAGRLNFIRQNYNKMYYQSLNVIYKELINKPAAGWAQRRQLLLTASAIWRYTFHGRSYDLKCQIEAAMECNDCGKFVRPMVERMIAEKLWV